MMVNIIQWSDEFHNTGQLLNIVHMGSLTVYYRKVL